MRNRAKFRGNRSEHDRHTAIFRISRWSRPPSWILKLKIFSGQQGYEGERASLCKISWQSVKALLRYGDFPIFHKGGRPPSCIVKISKF